MLYGRGSQETTLFGVPEARNFFSAVGSQLAARGIQSDFSELGNLDGDFNLEPGEYSAAYGLNWVAYPGYFPSVATGADELIEHLNDRTSRCPGEVVVLGGFSQGAHNTNSFDPFTHKCYCYGV